MPEFKFSGLYGDQTAPQTAIEANRSFAEQQKQFSDSIDQILLQQDKSGSNRAEVIEQLRNVAFSDAAKEMPSTNLMKLYTSFRDLNDYQDMARLYEGSTNERFKESPYVKEFLAVAYNKNGLAGKTLDTVSDIQSGASNPAYPRPYLMNGEVYGAMGKAYAIRQSTAEKLLNAIEANDPARIEAAKQSYTKAYDLPDNAPLPSPETLKDQSSSALKQGRDAYAKGFQVNYEYYPGINAAYGDLALGDFQSAQKTSELVHLAAIREGGLERGNYWTSMTMLESSILGGASKEEVGTTVSRILSGNDIKDGQMQSTFDAWDSRVRPALERMKNDPVNGAAAAKVLDNLQLAEAQLKEGVNTPAQKPAYTSPADMLIEKSHSYRGQSVFDAEIVQNNFRYGGIITDTSITRRDRHEFHKLLKMPVEDLMVSLGGDPSTLPAAARGGVLLGDIKDPEVFVETTQKIVRQNFGTEQKGLEIIDGIDHKIHYDHHIESLNEASGIPTDRTQRGGYDSRTSLASEFGKGLGDCRHHAQAMQLLYDSWQADHLNGYLRQAETASSPVDRAAAIRSFSELERTQLRTVDVEVSAPIKVNGAYSPIRPNEATSLPADKSFVHADTSNYIEDHTMTILVRRDGDGHVNSARYADAFYNQTYDWANKPIDISAIQVRPDGKFEMAGGVLNGVGGAAGEAAPVSLALAPYSGQRTRTAANDPGFVWERGLPLSHFDMIQTLQDRPQITGQLEQITHNARGMTVTSADLDFSKGTQVVSSAMKYVLPVPADAGEALVYPQAVTDAKGVAHAKGEAITTWDGKPLPGDGVVVFNSSEGIYQAGIRGKEGNDRSVIIINHVNEEQAKTLDKKIAELTNGKPENMTFAQFKEVESFARQDLGLTNMYDSSAGFVRQKMQDPFTNASGDDAAAFGFKKRNDRDVVSAIRMEEKGELLRPGKQALPFAQGSVLLKQGDDIRVITPTDLEKTYKSANDFSPVKTGAVVSHSTVTAPAVTDQHVSPAPAANTNTAPQIVAPTPPPQVPAETGHAPTTEVPSHGSTGAWGMSSEKLLGANGKLGYASIGINLADAVAKKDPVKAAEIVGGAAAVEGGTRLAAMAVGAKAIPVVGQVVGAGFAGMDAVDAAKHGNVGRAAYSGTEATLYSVAAGAGAVAAADCWNPTVIAPAAVALVAGGAAVTMTAARTVYDNIGTIKGWFGDKSAPQKETPVTKPAAHDPHHEAGRSAALASLKSGQASNSSQQTSMAANAYPDQMSRYTTTKGAYSSLHTDALASDAHPKTEVPADTQKLATSKNDAGQKTSAKTQTVSTHFYSEPVV